VARLPAERVRLGHAVQAVERVEGGYRVRLTEDVVEARSVIVAAPAPRAAGIVSAVLPRTSTWLGSIPFASTATVVLAYRRENVAHPLNGYGLVIPKTEGLRTSALSFLSTKFPGRAPADRALLRAFVGGARDPEVLELDDAALVALVTREMGPVVGLRGEPLLARVYRWPQGTPQMEVGHLERLAEAQAELQSVPGLLVAGAGLRSTGIPDMIADGRQAAEAALAFLVP
jgi:oxygen-dependent protoporphyrinogen oxidase